MSNPQYLFLKKNQRWIQIAYIVDESPADDQGDTMEGYEDYYEAGPSDPGAEDGKGCSDFDGIVNTHDGRKSCTMCGMIFSTQSNAKRHFRNQHTNTERIP